MSDTKCPAGIHDRRCYHRAAVLAVEAVAAATSRKAA